MQINGISSPAFSGLWTSTVSKDEKSVKYNGESHNLYHQVHTYHPFRDEDVTKLGLNESKKAVRYLEYYHDDDNFGGEDQSIAIQEVKIGKKLNITEKDYNRMLALKKAGEAAAKELSKLGFAAEPKFTLPTSGSNDVTSELSELDPAEIK